MLGRMHHAGMNAYFKNLLKKIVAAKERGMPTAEVARAFERRPLLSHALRQDSRAKTAREREKGDN